MFSMKIIALISHFAISIMAISIFTIEAANYNHKRELITAIIAGLFWELTLVFIALWAIFRKFAPRTPDHTPDAGGHVPFC